MFVVYRCAAAIDLISFSDFHAILLLFFPHFILALLFISVFLYVFILYYIDRQTGTTSRGRGVGDAVYIAV